MHIPPSVYRWKTALEGNWPRNGGLEQRGGEPQSAPRPGALPYSAVHHGRWLLHCRVGVLECVCKSKRAMSLHRPSKTGASRLLQYLPHFSPQAIHCKGLREDLDTVVQNAVVHNRVPCIATDEQDFDLRTAAAYFFSELSSVEARQSKVGKEQSHFRMALDDRQGRRGLSLL